jgi:hypothetical protein
MATSTGRAAALGWHGQWRLRAYSVEKLLLI